MRRPFVPLLVILLSGSAAAQFDGSYYSGTNFDTLVLTRPDNTIDFSWGSGSPGAGVPSDIFSVRWTGSIVPTYSEVYTFYVTSDDGIRLWVDGSLVIDDWTLHSPQQFSAQVGLSAGSPVDITLEFFEQTGGATCVFEWSSPSLTRQVVRTGTGALSQVVPVGPFLDNALPSGTPGTAFGNWILEDAYPNLRFKDPLTFTPEPGTNRIFVGSRQGRIEVFDNSPGATTKDLFLDVPTAVVWDGGFLGHAFHPEWNQAGSPNRNYFYVYYCYAAPGTVFPTTFGPSQSAYFFDCYLRLSRFTRPDGMATADPGSEQVLFNVRLFNGSHRGGGLFFRDDGFLYLSIGDQFRYTTAQDISANFEGGVIRIDVDQQGAGVSHPPRRIMGLDAGFAEEWSGVGYYIPNDNPFLDVNGGVFEEFWTVGNRNPHRMTLDVPTQRIWSGEIGQSNREEINVIVGGGNYQWPYMEGYANFSYSPPANPWGNEEPPVHDFTRSEANAIIGGYVYRGTQHPDLVGRYICGDYGQQRLWAMDYDQSTNTATKEYLTNFTPGALVNFGLDGQGEIYMCGLGNSVPIYRFGRDNGNLEAPQFLSQTGVFSDMASMTPHAALIPYNVNSKLWTDGAVKKRWMAIPNDGNPNTPSEQIAYSEVGEWGFPEGSVLVKHFETPEGQRLETRLFVNGQSGWYGVTYRYDASGLEAELLTTSFQEPVVIGGKNVNYYYPSRSDCLTCHNQLAGSVMGLKTRQLNSDLLYPSTGQTANQLETLNYLGLLTPPLDTTKIPLSITNAALDDVAAPVELRVRSYLDANCAQCHRPGQGHSVIDARSAQSLPWQGILDGDVTDDLGIPGARIVKPGDLSLSILYQRVNDTQGCCAMPPLGRGIVDQEAVALLEQWIQNMPVNAVAGTVAQSSTDATGPPENAVDVQLEGQHNGGAGPGPVTLTQSEPEPWWEADLGTMYALDKVRLWNRTDCCGDRLTNFYVFLSPNPFVGTTVADSLAQFGVTAVHYPGTVGREDFVDLLAQGRYLRIQRVDTGILSLAEVQLVGNTVAGAVLPPGLTILQPTGGQMIPSNVVDVIYITSGDLTEVDHARFVLDGGPEIPDLDLDGGLQIASVPDGLHTLDGFLVRSDQTVIAGTDASVSFSTASVSADPDLVAAYNFDVDEGGVVSDLSGNGNDGSCALGSTCPTHLAAGGNTGGAYDFTGNGNFIELSNEAAFDFTSSFTVSLWMNTANFGNKWAQLIGKGDSAWSLDRFKRSSFLTFTTWSLDRFKKSSLLTFTTLVPSPDSLVSSTAVMDGQWHHIAIVYDGSQKLLYVDGQLDAAKDFSRSIQTNDLNVRLGFNTEYAIGQYDGLIDDVRAYRRALTLAEIQTDMNTPVGGTPPPPPSPPPPALNILQPTLGQTILGDVVDVSYVLTGDLSEVDHVRFVLDGGPEISDLDLDGSLQLTPVPEGAHTLDAFLVRSDLTTIAGTSASVSFSTTVSVPSDLVAAYNFDADGGGFVADLSGNGNDGSCAQGSSCPTHLAAGGNTGGAYDFTGNGNYIELTNEAAFDFTSGFTVSLWMNTVDFGNEWAQLIGKGDSAWSLDRFSASNLLVFTTFAPGPDSLVSSTAVVDGQWHHIAIVYDGNQKLLYVDGVLDAAKAFNRSVQTNDLNVRLGFNTEYTIGQYDGLLDDVRVYSRALTPGEIQIDMNTAVGG